MAPVDGEGPGGGSVGLEPGDPSRRVCTQGPVDSEATPRPLGNRWLVATSKQQDQQTDLEMGWGGAGSSILILIFSVSKSNCHEQSRTKFLILLKIKRKPQLCISLPGPWLTFSP